MFSGVVGSINPPGTESFALQRNFRAGWHNGEQLLGSSLAFPELKWLPVISGLIAGYRAGMDMLHSIWVFLLKAFGHRSFAKITVEFLTEVSVLVFVFPTLDTIINHGQSKVSKAVVLGSLAITVVCLSVAGIISMLDRED